MSAPTVERATTSSRSPLTELAATPPPRTPAAARAYAQRLERRQRMAQAEGPTVAVARTPFVLLVMVLLGGGLITTLWLSTAAAADSYRLDTARRQARDLSEQSERLRREVAVMQAAPALAEAAGRWGMVPAGDPARLVVHPDGSVQVLGTPTAVRAPATQAPPVAVPATAQPAATQPATQPQLAQPDQAVAAAGSG